MIKKIEVAGLLILVFLDVLSKTLISSMIHYGETITIIKDFFWLTYLRNTGGAWSIFEGKTGLFLVVAVIGMLAMGYFFIKSDQKNIWLRIALILMFAGAFGNFMDRLLYGSVRDFLAFNIFGYMFPVFNVADMALNIGVACLIIESFVTGKKDA